MSKSVKFELNRSGVRDLLRSSGAMSECSGIAHSIANSLPAGYDVSNYTGQNRVNSSIKASTYAAYKDNLKNNTLLKAIGGRKK